jgi:hypothetical protein
MNNLTLSFELVTFLKWLLDNRKDALADLVLQAVKGGYLHYDFQGQMSNVGAHAVIKEFVDYLELSLKDALFENDSLETNLREQLTELANNIDLSSFDDTTILNGFKQAKKQIARISIPTDEYGLNKYLFKTMLIQTILDNWQPNKTAAQA